MSRLVTIGFESGAVAGEDPGYVVSGTDGAGSSATVVSTGVISGTRSLQIVTGSGGLARQWAFTATLSRTYHARGRFNYVSFVPGHSQVLALFELTAFKGLTARINGGVLQLVSHLAGTVLVTGPTLTAGREYCVEISYVPSTGACEVRLDGTSYGTATAETAASTNFILWTGSSTDGTNVTVTVDDYALNDDQGTAQNSWCGLGRVVMLLPVADSSNAGFSVSSGAPWQAVKNQPPGGLVSASGSSQIFDGTSNTTDNYKPLLQSYLAAGIPSSATITLVQGYANFGNNTTTSRTGGIQVISNPVVAETTGGSGTTAIGTFPTGWNVLKTAVVYAPSVTLGTGPVLEFRKATASTDFINADLLGLLVEYLGNTYTKSITDTLSALETTTTRAGVMARSTSDAYGLADAFTTRRLVGARSMTDSQALGEALAKAPNFPRSAVETIGLSESLARGAVVVRLVVEALTLAESMGRAYVGARHPVETLVLAEALTHTSAFTRLRTDSLGLSEVLTFFAAGQVRNLTELIGLGESLARHAVMARSMTETAAFAESLARADRATRAVIDALAASESLAHTTMHKRLPADTLALSESLAHLHARTLSLAETLHLTESLIRIHQSPRSVNEALGLTESLLEGAHRFVRLAAEPLRIADLAATTSGKNVSLDEGMRVAQAMSFLHTIRRFLTDSITLSEALGHLHFASRSVVDSLSVHDAPLIDHVNFHRTIIDVLRLAEALSHRPAHFRALTETLHASEALIWQHGRYRTLIEILGLGETFSRHSVNARHLTEAILLVEALRRHAQLARNPHDTLALPEALVQRWVTTRHFNDSLALADLVTRVFHGARRPLDPLILTESLRANAQRSRTATDAFGLADSTGFFRIYPRHLPDSLTLIERLRILPAFIQGFICLVPGLDQVIRPDLDAQLVIYPDAALNLLTEYECVLVPGTEAVIAHLPDWHYRVG